MIKELNYDDLESIKILEDNFHEVIADIQKDYQNNPFSRYLCYYHNDDIIGFINYYLMYDYMEIAQFMVLEKFQNQHIGTKLLEYLISEYQNKVKNITLEVKKDNVKAVGLYRKIGFQEVAVRKGYYQGIDGILMEPRMML